jgi:glucose-1-phosphate cytidylyltransferase
MVEIGGHPILWHIMKIYSYWGFNDFIILTGYKSHVIKDYFINYYSRYSDITVDMLNNTMEIHRHQTEPWKVTMLYTGQDTMTGGRLLRAKNFVGNERFMLTYGDGVGDVNIPVLIKNHNEAGKYVTLTSVRPTGRFGVLSFDEKNLVRSFKEKSSENDAWISGGFFVMEPEVFDCLDDGDKTVLEKAPLEKLVKDNQLNAYKHTGFWKPMDTLKDKNELVSMWETGKAPWALWLKENGN